MTMFKKYVKTKLMVKKNVNFMINLISSYDIPQRYQRRSLESDKKSRRHRKHRNDVRDHEINGGGSLRIKDFGVGQKKVGKNELIIFFFWDVSKNYLPETKEINCSLTSEFLKHFLYHQNISLNTNFTRKIF